ncbi:MAG: hypothetical protein M3N97_09700 [Pseudomonadota bacterium]|nr:hypothetical protein [Pseudomonadota bacterium]
MHQLDHRDSDSPKAAAAPDVQTGSTPEISAPMLDVHPPHESIHTWRSFFIHIATIVIGLLIAVALEQGVERVHEYYELNKIREELARELDGNRAILAEDERQWFVTVARLKNDLLVLEYIRQHPGTAQTALPGELVWNQLPFLWNHAVWDAAVTKGTVRLMALTEANRHQEFYELMALLSSQSLADWDAINTARRFDLLDSDPTHLAPVQLDEVIQLTETALAKHIQLGNSFGRYAHEFPELPHSITWDVVGKLRPAAAALDPTGMAGAHQRTEDRINAAVAEMTRDPSSPGLRVHP